MTSLQGTPMRASSARKMAFSIEFDDERLLVIVLLAVSFRTASRKREHSCAYSVLPDLCFWTTSARQRPRRSKTESV